MKILELEQKKAMIKPQELRICNYVFDIDGDILQVGEILDIGIKFKNTSLSSRYEKINPIPLTEEILLKFGFEKTANPRELKYDDYSILLLKEIRFVICNYMENPPSVKVSTVHQLQNLFFSLCGEELKFKDIS